MTSTHLDGLPRPAVGVEDPAGLATAAETTACPARPHRTAPSVADLNHVWAIAFQFDETIDRRRLKLTNIVDEHTREALAMRVARHCTAEDLIVELERLVVEYWPPSFLA